MDDQRASQALRLRANLTQLVGLGEDSTQVNAEVQIEVLQGLAPDVRLQLPEQFTVNQVAGATVADWEASARELTVTFIEPVTQTARVYGKRRTASCRGPANSTFPDAVARRRNARPAASLSKCWAPGEIKDRQGNRHGVKRRRLSWAN